MERINGEGSWYWRYNFEPIISIADIIAPLERRELLRECYDEISDVKMTPVKAVLEEE